VRATTETNTDTGKPSTSCQGKIHAFLDADLAILQGTPDKGALFRLKSDRFVTAKEATIRNGLLVCMRNYGMFRRNLGNSPTYAFTVQSGLPGRGSNARCEEFGSNRILIRVNVDHAPAAPEGMGKWDPRWILRKVCHELAEYQVVRALRSVERAAGKEEAMKIIRDATKDYYPDAQPSKYITN